MNNKKSNCPRLEPWGTPESTSISKSLEKSSGNYKLIFPGSQAACKSLVTLNRKYCVQNEI